jgi:hypothetical protein
MVEKKDTHSATEAHWKVASNTVRTVSGRLTVMQDYTDGDAATFLARGQLRVKALMDITLPCLLGEAQPQGLAQTLVCISNWGD